MAKAQLNFGELGGGGKEPIYINVYPFGTQSYGIGHIDVREFKSMTAQRKNTGMGIGLYSASSMSDTSKSTSLAITWGDTNVHQIDLTNVDYVYIWGDGALGAGNCEIVLSY